MVNTRKCRLVICARLSPPSTTTRTPRRQLRSSSQFLTKMDLASEWSFRLVCPCTREEPSFGESPAWTCWCEISLGHWLCFEAAENHCTRSCWTSLVKETLQKILSSKLMATTSILCGFSCVYFCLCFRTLCLPPTASTVKRNWWPACVSRLWNIGTESICRGEC